MLWLLIFVSFGLVINVFSEDTEFESPPFVITESGIVKGHVVKTNYLEYMAYLGIPYAAPPVGENRFKDPLPAIPWSGVLEANRTVQCPQSGSGEEDCLIINVFTPIPDIYENFQRPLPVLVFIHGGSFIRGSGPTTGMEHLLKHYIAVVTFNYRIGVLGFLCLGTADIPGNAGMKDQIAALQWIQRNIIHFGGHPKHVVIYGTDAGGASVDLLVLSQMSNGLFKSAIAESGSATSIMSIQGDPIQIAAQLAEMLNFLPKDIGDLAQFYKNKQSDDLTAINDIFQSSLTDGSVGFAPCIETAFGEKPHIRKFLAESPYDILIHGKYEKVPMMLIFSTLEGLFLKSSQYHDQQFKERLETNFEYFLPADLTFRSPEAKRIVADWIRTFYFGKEKIGDENIIQYLEYLSDSLVLQGILKSAEYHSNRMPVYMMEFLYKGHLRNYEPYFDNITVAGHSAASHHAFVPNLITMFADLRAVEKFAEFLTNFVKYDNPTPSKSDPVMWPRIEDPLNPSYLLFNMDPVVAMRPYWTRKTFWDSVYKRYRRQLTPVEPC